jgi:hypothetical protein
VIDAGRLDAANRARHLANRDGWLAPKPDCAHGIQVPAVARQPDDDRHVLARMLDMHEAGDVSGTSHPHG